MIIESGHVYNLKETSKSKEKVFVDYEYKLILDVDLVELSSGDRSITGIVTKERYDGSLSDLLTLSALVDGNELNNFTVDIVDGYANIDILIKPDVVIEEIYFFETNNIFGVLKVGDLVE